MKALLCAAAAAAIGLLAPEGALGAARAIGITETGNVVQFDAAAPGTLVSSVPLTGTGAGETVRGLDYRPKNASIVLLTRDAAGAGRLYRLDPNTGVASGALVLAADPADATTPYTSLGPASVGVDVNPNTDRVRIVQGTTNVNLRVNSANGLTFTDGDINTPSDALIDAVAYTNPVITAMAT